MDGQTKFEKLLSPLSIQKMQLRNRTVKTASSLGVAKETGEISDLTLCFYETLAKGGVAMIVVEHGFVDYPRGMTGAGRIANSDDKYLPGLTKLAAVMHAGGAVAIAQLGHAGPSQWKKIPVQPVAASALKGADNPQPAYPEARELSLAEIHDLVEKFARGAERAQKAGFDGVELHAAHNYLINTFLSRAWNRRQDEYGFQNMESRTRFVVEIIRTIRELAGPDFIVGVRMNGYEYGIKNGLTVPESQEIARILQEAGASYLSVSAWGFGPYDRLCYPEQMLYPEPQVPLAEKVYKPGALVPLAAAVKQVATIPVLAIGRLDAELGEWILQNNMADLIGFTRRLFADPEYPRKVAEGRLEDIAPCTACLECLSRQEKTLPIRCRINAAFGRGYDFALKPAAVPKKVVVVGGGPAGMEAARVAALRGHHVTLYEKEHKLGGLLPLATMIKGTEIEDLPKVSRYLERQVRSVGVRVCTGVEATAELIGREKPDAVVIAGGGLPVTPNLPGIEKPHVVSTQALHRQSKFFMKLFGPRLLRRLSRIYLPIGRRVIIIGGAIQGCETAEFLTKLGRKVTLLESSEELGAGVPSFYRPRLLWWLAKSGVFLLSGVTITEITDEGVAIITREGERKELKADTVMAVVPPRPNKALFEALQGKVSEVYRIGDAREGSEYILGAVSDGAEIGRVI
ncbi:MAG: FAD-dependent oxidoreductase [Deltaproteobacteria bacterium]|nr:FAD-dependent oxidoreductase [Deltaproteobacteria bacterium]